MIRLIDYPMTILDAAKYYGEFDDGTTVNDVVDWILENYPDQHGTIEFEDFDFDPHATLKEFQTGFTDRVVEIPYQDGKIDEKYQRDYKDRIGNRTVVELRATLLPRSMSFNVEILYHEEVK